MPRKPALHRRKYVEQPVMLTIRMTKAEHGQLRQFAERAGANLTEWMRRTLFGAAGVPLDGARRKGGWPLGRRRGNGPPVDCQDDELSGAAPQAPRIAQDARGTQSGPFDGSDSPDAA